MWAAGTQIPRSHFGLWMEWRDLKDAWGMNLVSCKAGGGRKGARKKENVKDSTRSVYLQLPFHCLPNLIHLLLRLRLSCQLLMIHRSLLPKHCSNAVGPPPFCSPDPQRQWNLRVPPRMTESQILGSGALHPASSKYSGWFWFVLKVWKPQL